ncbi:DUF6304 family protein [Sphingobacterium tabacisoli]|uniref:DUF6304 family protein n=1 Tax=Sphingobacterium tabacisoli TaxID=2044855 RepID=A0ABW5L8H3_9SPHI|nr:DUF6304 family protein [Sphingobacterium tabacisoli]
MMTSQEMIKYTGSFSNKTGTYSVEVYNDFDDFYMQIGRFKFSGFDLDSFELDNPEEFSDQELIDFDIINRKIDAQHTYIELRNYSLSLQIPQTLIVMSTKEEINIVFNLRLELFEKHEKALLSFNIKGEYFEAKNGFMEMIMDDLQRQFAGRYRFKNCYGCLYGDYSIYGQGLMGPILCFKNQKEKYLDVQNKNEYMELKKHESAQQEIYCCADYEPRNRVVGYRGTIMI